MLEMVSSSPVAQQAFSGPTLEKLTRWANMVRENAKRRTLPRSKLFSVLIKDSCAGARLPQQTAVIQVLSASCCVVRTRSLAFSDDYRSFEKEDAGRLLRRAIMSRDTLQSQLYDAKRACGPEDTIKRLENAAKVAALTVEKFERSIGRQRASLMQKWHKQSPEQGVTHIRFAQDELTKVGPDLPLGEQTFFSELAARGMKEVGAAYEVRTD